MPETSAEKADRTIFFVLWEDKNLQKAWQITFSQFLSDVIY
jgi:hypothetical protein